MESNFNSLRVMLHGQKQTADRDGDMDKPLDITAFVSHLEWDDSVAPPWGTCLVQLQLQKHQLDGILPGTKAPLGVGGTFSRRMKPGAWLIIGITDPSRGMAVTAFSFCQISEVTIGFGQIPGIGQGGPTGTVPVTLHGQSWLTAAGQSQMRIVATNETAVDGFIYTMTSWSDTLRATLQSANNPDLGSCLQKLWQDVAMLRPPDTLLASAAGADVRVSESFGGQVPVVYGDTLAQQFAPARVGAMHEVFGKALLCLPKTFPNTPMWQWLHTSFVPDSSLVELFPSLEWPAETDGTDPIGAGPAYSDDVLTEAAKGGEADPRSEGTRRLGSANWTQLGHKLGGAQPILVYRFKPFQIHGINKVNAQRARASLTGDDTPSAWTPMSEKLGLFQQGVRPIPNDKWVAKRYAFERNDILHVSNATVSENARVNLVFARNIFSGATQDTGVRFYSQVGNAVMMPSREFVQYGLHAVEPIWPYLLPLPGEVGGGTGAPVPTKATLDAAATAATAKKKKAVADAEALKASALAGLNLALANSANAVAACNVAIDARKAAHAAYMAAPKGTPIETAALAVFQAADAEAQYREDQRQLMSALVRTDQKAYDQAVKALDAAKEALASPTTAAAGSSVVGSSSNKKMTDHLTALNEKLWTLLGQGEAFVNLTMQVRCRPRVKAGMWIRAHVATPLNVQIGEHHVGLEPYQYQYLTAYIDKVTHKMTRGPKGAWTTGTTLHLVRGMFSFKPAHFFTPVLAASATRNERAAPVVATTAEISYSTETENVVNGLHFGKRTQKILGIVFHITETSTPTSTKSVFLAKTARGNPISTNYEVDAKGAVVMYADPGDNVAYATGNGGNVQTIGIDITSVQGKGFPELQIQAAAELCLQLATRFGFTRVVAPDLPAQSWQWWRTNHPTATLFRHRNFVNKECPVDFPMDRMTSAG